MLSPRGGRRIYPVALRAISATVPGDELNLSKHGLNKYLKIIKNRPKIFPQGPLRGLLEALGQLLEGSWGPLGGLLGLSWLILAPRPSKTYF